MDDLISRQAAIDALIAEGRNVDSRYLESERVIHESDAVEAIAMLPSAQPALDEWCTDCKEYDQERHCCPRWNRVIRTALDDARKELSPAQPEERTEERTETHACDCISRQAAVDAFPEKCMAWDTYDGYIAPHVIRRILSELPSAQPEITDEQAIEHLQSTGWMQSHDRILTERRNE